MFPRLRPLIDALITIGPDRDRRLIFMAMLAANSEAQIGDGRLLEKILAWIAANPDEFKDLIRFIIELFS